MQHCFEKKGFVIVSNFFIIAVLLLGLLPGVAEAAEPTTNPLVPESIILDYEWYDPTEPQSACGQEPGGTTGNGSVVGNGRQEQAFNYFMTNLKLNPVQASVIVGVMMGESGSSLDPNATNSRSGAYGIAQWLGPRKTGLIQFAASNGKPKNDFVTQLQYAVKELSSSHSASIAVIKNVKSPTDISDGVYDFEAAFERSGHEAISIRTTFARQIYNKYGKNAPTTTGATQPTADTPGNDTPSESCPSGGSTAVASGDCKVTAPVRGEGSTNRRQMSQSELERVYGDPGTASSHPEISSKLVSVDFLGRKVKVHQLVAGCLKAVADEIKANNINYKIKEMGCYRYDGNGAGQIGTRSYHTYGAACDINWSTNPFSAGPTSYDMPKGYVDAFHHHGWSWGGNWRSVKDYMHFEFNGITP